MRQKKYLLGDSEIPTRFIAAEPVSCPKLTRGKFEYDFGDEAGLTPLLPMYTLGHTFKPSSIHAGGQMQDFSISEEELKKFISSADALNR